MEKKTGKAGAPKEHWEIKYNQQESRVNRPEAKFDPIRAKDRPKLYNKVNESDH